MATAATAPTMEGVVGNAAWSSEEHDRFLEALEKYGNGNTGDEWALMAKHVGTRAPNEIKLHAHKYFLRLQLAPGAASTGDAGVSGSRAVSCLDPAFDESDADWTQREDSRFEDALAQFGEGIERRWERIAALLPGKTAAAVQRRFQKLLCDVACLSAGQHVELVYKTDDGAAAAAAGLAIAAAAAADPCEAAAAAGTQQTNKTKRELEEGSPSPSGRARSKRRA